MKKIALILSLCAASSAFAATAFPAAGQPVTGGTGGNCPLLDESVTPRLSNNVAGAYNCNTDNGYIGIGTASSGGAGWQYGASNKGGTISRESCTSVAANYVACAATAADAASET